MKMPRIKTSTFLGINTFKLHKAILPWDLWKRWDDADFTHGTWLLYITLPFLPWLLAWVSACVRTPLDVCLRVFSALLTFPQTWLTFPGDLKTWSLLCLKSCVLPSSHTEGNAAAEPAACPAFRALVYSIWSGPSSFTRSVIRRRPALYIACLLETTGSLLGLFLSLAVFPWGVECFCFSQLRQKSYKQKIWEKKVDRDSVGGSERERKQECVMERGRDPFLLLQAG